MGNIMERADEQILPALYGFVAASFHIGPTQLGYLTLSRALVQAVASPLGGILGELCPKAELEVISPTRCASPSTCLCPFGLM